MGNQYTIIPIAFGALLVSGGFVLYSAIAGLYLLGASSNCHLPFFNLLGMNLVWLAACWWFFTEFRRGVNKNG